MPTADPFDPRRAYFVFSYYKNAQRGDTTVLIVDTAYRVNRLGHSIEGTLNQIQLDAFIAQLAEGDVWSLDGREDREQRTCLPNVTVDVRIESRRHHVTFYGAPNDRVERFTAMLSQGLFDQLLREAGKSEEI
jgi:hypothetical protein